MNREVHVQFWESAGLQCLALLAYLRAYDTVSEARTSIGSHLGFYNSGRPHSSLDRQTPDQAYFNRAPRAASGVTGRWASWRWGPVKTQREGCEHDALCATKLGQR